MRTRRDGLYEPNKLSITILAILSILHYYITITIVYELGNFNDDHKYYMYEISLIIIVLCMLILIRVSIMLTSTTSHIAFIAVILAPMLSVFMNIDESDLYYAHEFQTFMILFNFIFHLIVLCVNVDEWINMLCFISFIDGTAFISIAIFLLSTASYQHNKLLPFNILLEITLLLFAIIIIGMSARNEILFYFTLSGMVNYFIFNIPFLKTYLIWQYMYEPAKQSNFDFIIRKSDNNIGQIIRRLYGRIHCMSHSIKWQWRSNETTQLLSKRGDCKLLKYHEVDTVECWKLQYEFMNLEESAKKIFVEQFANRDWNFCQNMGIVYYLFSVISYIYPILWLIMSHILTKQGEYGFHIKTAFQAYVIWLIILMYASCLAWSIGFAIRNKLFTYKAMVYYVNMGLRYDIHASPNKLMECCVRMEEVKVIIDNLQSDIAFIVLLYCYKRHNVINEISDIDPVSLDSTLPIYNSPPFVV